MPGFSTPNNVTNAGGGAEAADTSSSQSIAVPVVFNKRILSVTRGDSTPPPPTDGSATGPGGPRLAVGDIVTFELSYGGSPDADQLRIELSDTLPLAYRYVPGSSRYSGTYSGQVNNANLAANPDALCAPNCPSGSVLGWLLTGSGGNQITPINQSITIQFQAQVTAGTAGEVVTNYGKFTGSTSDGGTYTSRAQLDLTTLAANLVLTKSNSSTGAVQGNAIISYTVTIQNTGTSTAYRIGNLTDAVPPDLKFLHAGTVTPAGAATFGSYVPGPDGFGGTLTYTNLADIAPGGTVSITYTAQVQPLARCGRVRRQHGHHSRRTAHSPRASASRRRSRLISATSTLGSRRRRAGEERRSPPAAGQWPWRTADHRRSH